MGKRTLHTLYTVSFILFYSFCYGQAPSASYTSNVTGGCSPLVVNFTDASTGNPTSWSWDLGNGTTSTKANPSASYFTPGVYNIKLTVSNGNGTSTTTGTITVYESPEPDFSANKQIGCAPYEIQFTDNSTAGSGNSNTSWLWDLGNGTTSTNQNPTVRYSSQGKFTIVLKVTNDKGCSKTTTKSSYITITPGVNPNFSNSDPTVCKAPFPISFNNASTGPGNLTYTWLFGDGQTQTSSSQNISHSYTAPGAYSVTLIESSDLGCSDTLYKDSAVVIPNVKTDFKVPDTICVGSQLTFINTSTPDPISSKWTFSDGTNYSTLNVTKTFSTAGNYNIKLSNVYPTCSGDTTKTIAVINNPVAKFTPDKSGQCKPDLTVNFTNQSQNAVTFVWDFGDSTAPVTVNSMDNVSHTFTKYGEFPVTLTAYNTNGCSATYTYTIKVLQPTIRFTNLPRSGCIPLTITPTVQISSINSVTSYLWDLGDGTTSTDQKPSHTYTAQGAYPITLTITTVDGCTISDTLPVGVRVGERPIPAFTASPTEACAITQINFTNQTVPPTATSVWDFGDGSTSVVKNPSHNYMDTGWFQVKLVANNSGCRDSITSPVNYIHIKPPVAKFSLIPNCTTPYQYSFKDESLFDPESAGNRTWAWKFPDGSTSSSQTPPDYTFPGPGTYNITLTVSNGTCTHTLSQPVNIVDKTPDFTMAKDQECKPSYVSFTAVSNDASNVTNYAWSVDGKVIQSNSSPGLYNRFDQSGNFIIKVTTTDKFGCNYSTTKPLHISGPQPDFNGINIAGCKGLTATFSDQSNNDGVNQIVDWKWDFGDKTPVVEKSTGDTVNHVFNRQGSFSVKLVLKDNAGCTDSIIKTNYVRITTLRANWNSSTQICLGNPITFNNTSTGRYISALWYFGDGKPPVSTTDKSGNYTYQDTGLFTIKLVIADAIGCKDSLTKDSIVHISKPKAAFTVNDSISYCPPFDVAFTNTSQFATNAEWTFNNNESSDQWDARKLFTIPGAYPVKLKVSSPDGNCWDSTTKTITLYNSSDATINYDILNPCRPSTVNLSAFSRLSSARFVWDFGDGNILDTTVNEVSHVYSDLGEFTPKIIMTESTGCVLPIEGKDPIVVKGARAKFGIDNTFFCDSGFVHVFDSTIVNEPIKTYNWNFGDGTIDHDSLPVHHYVTPGLFPVSLTVETVSGCKDTAHLDAPVEVVLSPLISISGDSVVCVNQFMKHIGNFDRVDTTVVRWSWAFPNGNTSTDQNPTDQLYTTAGDYVVTANATNSSGCTGKATKNIRINPLPVITMPSAVTMQVTYPVPIPATYSPNVVSYNWQPATGLNCTDCATPIAQPKFNTTYTVSVVDSNGCKNSDTVQVIVVCKNANVFVPNTFSPNGDGVNDVFYVRGRGLERVKTLRIFNRWGEIVFEQNNFPVNDASYGWDGKVKGNRPQQGVYIYQLEVFCDNSQIIHIQGNIALIQ